MISYLLAAAIIGSVVGGSSISSNTNYAAGPSASSHFNANTNAPPTTYQVPTFDISDLKTGRRTNELLHVLGSTGLLAVTLDGQSHKSSLGSGHLLDRDRQVALGGLCDCADDNLDGDSNNNDGVPLLSVPGTDSAILTDAKTTRTTLATATVGYTPLPLPRTELTSSCGSRRGHGEEDASSPAFIDAMDGLRDAVADASSAFIGAVDALLQESSSHSSPPPLLKTDAGATYGSIADIVGASKNLEHFHVYSRNEGVVLNEEKVEGANIEEDNDDDALRLHTDAGLFLSFIPALSCQSSSHNDPNNDIDKSFYVLDPQDGKTKVASFPQHRPSVAIMLGIGAETWLNLGQPPTYGRQSAKLRATRHKVHMSKGDRRAWYGMMHLVPDSSVVQASPQRTFGDMRKYVAHQGSIASRRFGDDIDGEEAEVAIGCGIGTQQQDILSPHDSEPGLVARTHRRRLQHVKDGSVCNNVTNFYCWMICQEIPDADNAASRLEEGESLYCLDEAVLGGSDQVGQAVAQCIDYKGVLGAAENPSCVGSWQPTAPGIPKQHMSIEHGDYDDDHDYEDKYCYSSTSMYMHGFEWQGTTCLAYLFQSWVLNTPAKFVAASVGTLFFGILLEGSIHLRRTLIAYVDTKAAAAAANGSAPPSAAMWKHTAASAGTYMIQLTLGYLIMLVVMTYSAPLFICVIMGLVSGHILFAILRSKKEKSCACAPKEEAKYSTVGNTNGYAMPEGSTPCCMNELPGRSVLATNPLTSPLDYEEGSDCCCEADEEEDDCHKESAPTSCCAPTSSSCCESGTGTDNV